MRSRCWSATLLGLGLVACSPRIAEDADPPASDAPVVEGHFIWGAEVRSFTPCGDTLNYWVTAPDDTARELESRYRELAGTPYQPMFVRIIGYPAGRAADGFAADYDSLFRIEEIRELRRASGADCAAAPLGG